MTTSGPDPLCPWNRQVVFTEEAALWMLEIMHIAQLSTTDIHRKKLRELLLNVKEVREYISRGPWLFCQALCTQLRFSFMGKTFRYWLEPKWDYSIYCKNNKYLSFVFLYFHMNQRFTIKTQVSDSFSLRAASALRLLSDCINVENMLLNTCQILDTHLHKCLHKVDNTNFSKHTVSY